MNKTALTPEILLACMDAGRTLDRDAVEPLSDWASAETIAEAICAARRARGERPIGWKVGLTNLAAWPKLGIDRPIWGRMYQSTVTLLDSGRCVLDLAGLSSPRIEPEIVIGMARAPASDAPIALLEATAWIALGYEIVHTPSPEWRSVPQESHAAQGMHARLLVGPRRRPDELATSLGSLADALAAMKVTLSRDESQSWSGTGAVVLGSPLASLGRLVRELATRGKSLGTGDVITTGTLTDAQPLGTPARWTTRIEGLALPDLILQSR